MLVINNEIIKYSGLTESQLKSEIACLLYSQNRLSFGQAKNFAEVNVFEFQKLLNEKNIPLHYSIEDFEKDLQVLNF